MEDFVRKLSNDVMKMERKRLTGSVSSGFTKTGHATKYKIRNERIPIFELFGAAFKNATKAENSTSGAFHQEEVQHETSVNKESAMSRNINIVKHKNTVEADNNNTNTYYEDIVVISDEEEPCDVSHQNAVTVDTSLNHHSNNVVIHDCTSNVKSKKVSCNTNRKDALKFQSPWSTSYIEDSVVTRHSKCHASPEDGVKSGNTMGLTAPEKATKFVTNENENKNESDHDFAINMSLDIVNVEGPGQTDSVSDIYTKTKNDQKEWLPITDQFVGDAYMNNVPSENSEAEKSIRQEVSRSLKDDAGKRDYVFEIYNDDTNKNGGIVVISDDDEPCSGIHEKDVNMETSLNSNSNNIISSNFVIHDCTSNVKSKNATRKTNRKDASKFQSPWSTSFIEDSVVTEKSKCHASPVDGVKSVNTMCLTAPENVKKCNANPGDGVKSVNTMAASEEVKQLFTCKDQRKFKEIEGTIRKMSLDIEKIEGQSRSGSALNKDKKTVTVLENIQKERLPIIQLVDGAYKNNVKSENLTTETLIQKEEKLESKQGTSTDNESKMSRDFKDITAKKKNLFEVYFDTTDGNIVEISDDDTSLNATHLNDLTVETPEGDVKSGKTMEATASGKEIKESCHLDKGIHCYGTSIIDMSDSERESGFYHKTDAANFVQGFKTAVRSSFLSEDDSSMEINIADDEGDGNVLFDSPDRSANMEGNKKGHDMQKQLIRKNYSKNNFACESIITTSKNTLSSCSMQQNYDDNATEKLFQDSERKQSPLQIHDVRANTDVNLFKCSVCNKAYFTNSELQNHVKLHACTKTFECLPCGKSFSKQKHLTNHIKTHSQIKPFQCSSCSESFSLRQSLLKHIKTHSRKYQCPICSKAFSKPPYLRHHVIRIHSEENPRFECKFCDKVYFKHASLLNHTRTHTGNQPFKCTTCGKSFLKRRSLEIHTMTHKGEKPFKCKICGKAFNKSQSLKHHTMTHTGEKPFGCKTCGKSFILRRSLKIHRMTHTGEKPFGCPICGKAYSRRHSLQVHTKSHTGEKPFVCPTCGKAFSLSQNLQRHTGTHTGEKSFECKICGKVFPHRESLQNHIMTHKGEKPFECQTCGKVYSYRQNLQRHIKTHTREEAFKCETCGKVFSHHRTLQSHNKTHTREETFECQTCGKVYSTRQNLRRHIKTHARDKALEFPTIGKAFSNLECLQDLITNNKREKTFECPACGKAFCQRHDLQNHIKTHRGEKPFKCFTCDKAYLRKNSFLNFHNGTQKGDRQSKCLIRGNPFYKKSHLQSHIGAHSSEKAFTCETCCKVFFMPGALRRHVRIHASDTPYKCSTCGKAFSLRSSLKHHIRIHLGESPNKSLACNNTVFQSTHPRSDTKTHSDERPFACETCGKSFCRRGHLDAHKMTHTTEKPFSCSTCDKRFSLRRYLQAHEKTHPGENPFACSTCGKTFSLRKYLQEHLKIHIGEILMTFEQANLHEERERQNTTPHGAERIEYRPI